MNLHIFANLALALPLFATLDPSVSLSHVASLKRNGRHNSPCGQESAERSEDKSKGNPWLVSIHLTFVPRRLSEGALITPHWLATVAHALIGQDRRNLKISTDHENRMVDRLELHPLFSVPHQEHDLALLRVTSPFTAFVETICPVRVAENIICKESCDVEEARERPEFLSVMDRESCQREFRQFGMEERVQATVVCVADVQRKVSACSGSSGMPLTCLNNEDERVLTGLLSLGWNCANPSSPAIFTKISDYYGWISSLVKEGTFDLLEYCSRHAETKFIKSVREGDDGLHIDVFIPNKRMKPAKPYYTSSFASPKTLLQMEYPRTEFKEEATTLVNITSTERLPQKQSPELSWNRVPTVSQGATNNPIDPGMKVPTDLQGMSSIGTPKVLIHTEDTSASHSTYKNTEFLTSTQNLNPQISTTTLMHMKTQQPVNPQIFVNDANSINSDVSMNTQTPSKNRTFSDSPSLINTTFISIPAYSSTHTPINMQTSQSAQVPTGMAVVQVEAITPTLNTKSPPTPKEPWSLGSLTMHRDHLTTTRLLNTKRPHIGLQSFPVLGPVLPHPTAPHFARRTLAFPHPGDEEVSDPSQYLLRLKSNATYHKKGFDIYLEPDSRVLPLSINDSFILNLELTRV